MNKDKRNNIQLLGTLNNADESGIIANANQVYDANEDKSTQDVSKEHKERIETLETKESSMQTTLENITKTGEASAASNVTYNHSDSKLDATNMQQAIDEISTKTVFDISAYHATGGTLATYADLSAALDSNNGGGVPQYLQKGGMSVKFVQSSDNKYVQYRLMTNTFSSTVANWQGVDEEPTAGSKNLVESDGIYQETMYPKNVDITSDGTLESGYITNNGDITDFGRYNHFKYLVHPHAKYHIEGQLQGNVYIGIYSSSEFSHETATRLLGPFNPSVNIDIVLDSNEHYIGISTAYNIYPQVILTQIKIKDEITEIKTIVSETAAQDILPTKDSTHNIQSNAVLIHGSALDISVMNAVNGTAKSYTTLELALADIPSVQQCGGLVIKYIDSESQEYKFSRYIGTTTGGDPNPFLNPANWQGVDMEAKKDSHNLIESGEVYDRTTIALNKDITSEGVVEYGYINNQGNIIDFGGYSHYKYQVHPHAKYHIEGELQGNVPLVTFSSDEFSSSTRIRDLGLYNNSVNIDVVFEENEYYLGIPTKYGKHPDITIIEIPVASAIKEINENIDNIQEEIDDINNKKIDDINNKKTNYHGITVGVLGDSLATRTRYVQSIVNKLGVTISSVAHGGRRIPDYATDAILNALSNNTKIVIVQGGTNDWEQVGDIEIGNYDTSTLCGAFNVMLSKLYYKFLHQAVGYYAGDGVDYSGVTQISSPVTQLPIFVILPPVAPKEPYASYKDRIERNSNALKQIAYMWGLPVIDARLIGASEMTITSADKIHGCMEFFNMLDALVYSKFMEYEPGMTFFNDVKTLYTITASIPTGSVDVSASAYNGNQVYFTIEDNTSYTNILIQDADENTINYETIDLSKHAYAFRMPSSNVTITVS